MGLLRCRLEGLEAQKKALDEMTSAAKKWADSIATPEEKLAEQLDEIDRLLKRNMLTEEQARKARQKANDDIYGRSKIDPKKTSIPTMRTTGIDKLPTIERRFTAGFSAEIAKSRQGWEQKMLNVTQKIQKAEERTARNTDALRQRSVALALNL